MNAITLFLPIFIVIGLAALGLIINRTVNKRRNYSYSKRTRMIFTGYLSLLILCAIVDLVIPGKETLTFKKMHDTDITKEGTDLYTAALSGKINQVNQDFKVTDWKFDYHEQKLTLNYQDGEYPNFQVVIERKSSEDPKLEAAFYRTRASINNLDITNSLHIPGVKLSGNQLILLKPEKTKLKYSEFANVFPVNQFTGKKSFSYSSDFNEGQGLLYLRIPKDIQVETKANLNVDYVK
jgi:hypothetical protein